MGAGSWLARVASTLTLVGHLWVADSHIGQRFRPQSWPRTVRSGHFFCLNKDITRLVGGDCNIWSYKWSAHNTRYYDHDSRTLLGSSFTEGHLSTYGLVPSAVMVTLIKFFFNSVSENALTIWERTQKKTMLIDTDWHNGRHSYRNTRDSWIRSLKKHYCNQHWYWRSLIFS